MKEEISWKVVSYIKDQPPVDKKSLLFNITPNTGLYSQFSIPLNYSYIPYTLSPTTTFHHRLKKFLASALNLQVSDNKFPYTLDLSGFGKVHVNFNIRLYLTNIVTITVVVSPFELTELSPAEVVKFNEILKIAPISNIIDFIISAATNLGHSKPVLGNRWLSKCAIHLYDLGYESSFQTFRHTNSVKLVSILIRDINEMHEELVKKVIEKNHEHNVKNLNELLLVDKQSILFLSSNLSKAKNAKARLKKAHDLVEIAMVCDVFIKNFPQIRAVNCDFADFVMNILLVWLESPDTILSHSYTHSLIWNLILSEFKLHMTVGTAKRNIEDIEGKRKIFAQYSDNWWEQVTFPILLSQKIAAARGCNLNFISDASLQKIIYEDIDELHRCILSKNFKSAIILAGSIAEASLMAYFDYKGIPRLNFNYTATDGSTKSVNEHIYQSNLNNLLIAAKHYGLVTNQHILSFLHSIRDWRNLVHPGKQRRQGIDVTPEMANIANDVLTLMIRQLK